MPLWCTTSNNGQIINISPLIARNKAQRVVHHVDLAGYKRHTLTGHSKCKGTANSGYRLDVKHYERKRTKTEQVC